MWPQPSQSFSDRHRWRSTMAFKIFSVTLVIAVVALADETVNFVPRNPAIPVGRVFPQNGELTFRVVVSAQVVEHQIISVLVWIPMGARPLIYLGERWWLKWFKYNLALKSWFVSLWKLVLNLFIPIKNQPKVYRRFRTIGFHPNIESWHIQILIDHFLNLTRLV